MLQPRDQATGDSTASGNTLDAARRSRWMAPVSLTLLYGIVIAAMFAVDLPPLALGLPLIPILLAAVLYQIPGGMAAALLGAFVVGFKTTLDAGWPWPAELQTLGLITMLTCFGTGALVGWISQRERRQAPGVGTRANTDDLRSELQAALENAPVAVLMADKGGFLQMANPAALEALGLKPPVKTGQDIASVVPDKALADLFYKATLGGEAVTGEVSGAGDRILSARVSPVSNVGNIAVLQDVTHLKLLNQRKTEMISTVSHDLKNPLSAIQGYADLIIKMGSLNERQAKFMERIRLSATRLIELTTDLLDVAWIESGMETRRERANLTTITREAADGFQIELATKSLELVKNIAATGTEVLGDDLRLRQLVDNLIRNAIKYSDKGGKVTVVLRREDESVYLEVKDTGSGIAEENLDKAFDRYFRVDETDEQASGSGLGLAIVKAIAEQHGGSVEVESAEGKGSTFRVKLPVASTEPAGERRQNLTNSQVSKRS